MGWALAVVVGVAVGLAFALLPRVPRWRWLTLITLFYLMLGCAFSYSTHLSIGTKQKPDSCSTRR